MYIRRTGFLLIVLAVALTLACTAEKEPVTFSILGNVKNPRAGKIVLTQNEDINKKKVKYITEIKLDADGKFHEEFDLEPHIYTLDFYGEKKVTLAIDKGQTISIEADGNDLSNVKVSGSADTAKLEAYEKFRMESLNRLVISVRDRLKATGDYNNTGAEKAGADEIENYEKHKDELNDFVSEKMGDSIAIYSTSLRWDGEKNFSLFEGLASNFEKKHGDIEIAKRLKEKIVLLKATSVGGKSATIEMTDKDGKLIAMDPSKAKYTLVDFWASWCGPCRRESKTLASLYKKYNDKGFEVYSVSLDDDREKWLEASEKDERVWTNVSTLKAFETPAAFEYSVTALPAKFLIDSEGIIIAKDLHGTKLEETLIKLLSK